MDETQKPKTPKTRRKRTPKEPPEGTLTPEQIINLPFTQRTAYFENYNINPVLLESLLEKMKEDKKVSEILGQIYLAIVKKVSGMPSWKGYSEDWLDEFRERALTHLISYAHNFRKEKSKRDCTNYLIQMCFRAFQQSLKKCKKRHAMEGVHLNDATNGGDGGKNVGSIKGEEPIY